MVMENPRPVTRITICLDKERTVILDGAAMRRWEEIYPGESSLLFWGEMKIGKICTLLYLGLLRESPDITQEMVDGMVDVGNISYVIETMVKAIEAAQAKASGDGPPLVGSNSGLSVDTTSDSPKMTSGD